MPGPPPKPTELKRRLGNPGKEKLPVPVVTLAPSVDGPPPPPPGLRRVGKAAWLQYWQVGAVWLSPAADFAVMARLCRTYDEEAALLRVLRRDGRFTQGSKGQLVSHPAVAQLRAVQQQLVRDEAQCGFGPANRSRLGFAEVKRVSKLEAFLAARQQRPGRGAVSGDVLPGDEG